MPKTAYIHLGICRDLIYIQWFKNCCKANECHCQRKYLRNYRTRRSNKWIKWNWNEFAVGTCISHCSHFHNSWPSDFPLDVFPHTFLHSQSPETVEFELIFYSEVYISWFFSISFLVHSFNVICQWYWCKSSGRLYWQHCIRTEIGYIISHKIVLLLMPGALASSFQWCNSIMQK